MDSESQPPFYTSPEQSAEFLSDDSASTTDLDIIESWRVPRKLKTVHGVLVLCMNFGVDPPDAVKIQPCATMECWYDTTRSIPPQKILEHVSAGLKAQYEGWQGRGKFRLCPDPTSETVKKQCSTARRSAGNERVLFHYNGHGVPCPSVNGELWVFNADYTQYIPLSILTILDWVGSPSLFVFDCSSGGSIVTSFERAMRQHGKNEEIKDIIMLAPCSQGETLPMNPVFPADIFTACLTTPIKLALMWHCYRFNNSPKIPMEKIDKIPGRATDRKTPIGALTWVLTAITDTIAWSVLPHDMFRKLYRQDLLVSSLMRNFLLADRILRLAACTPVSLPSLPPTHNHPLWDSWDFAMDTFLAHLPQTKESEFTVSSLTSSFFEDQLTAFEVWLDMGSRQREPPYQLPIVLQVLLSATHRECALKLLARFSDLGPWAVNICLSVGIFPYVLKLLQSNSVDLREHLVFIWAKILAVDKSCQDDILKDNAHIYFINILANPAIDSDIRAMAAFVLSVIVDGCQAGRSACLHHKLLSVCTNQLIEDPEPYLKKWLCLCISKLLEDYPEAKWLAAQDQLHHIIARLLADDSAQVRAAATLCAGTLIDDHALLHHNEQVAVVLGNIVCALREDGSAFVRKETAIVIGILTRNAVDIVSDVVSQAAVDERSRRMSISSSSGDLLHDMDDKEGKRVTAAVRREFYRTLWLWMQLLSADPVPAVANVAKRVCNYVISNILKKSSPEEEEILPEIDRSTMYRQCSAEFRIPHNTIHEREHFDIVRMARVHEKARKALSDAERIKEWNPPRVDSKRKSRSKVDLRWSTCDGYIENSGRRITSAKFHPYEASMVFADISQRVAVWHWKGGNRVKYFDNGNSGNSRISSLEFLNTMDDTLLMTNSDDGHIRVWKGIMEEGVTPTLVGGFIGVPDCVCRPDGPGMVSSWQQRTGHLMISADNPCIRLWDLNSERCVSCFMTGAQGDRRRRVACMDTMDEFNPEYVVAGCKDGTIVVMDKRMHARRCVVQEWCEHETDVIHVSAARLHEHTVVSGSLCGDLRFWDIRKRRSKAYLDPRMEMTVCSIHNKAALIATGSLQQFLQVMDLEGNIHATVYYHDGFLDQWDAPLASLFFHPNRFLLAAAPIDATLSIYAP